MTKFDLSLSSMWNQPPSAKKAPSAPPVGHDQLSPFRKSAVAAASPSSKVIPTLGVEETVHVETSPVLLDGGNLNQVPVIDREAPPVPDREAEFRRRGPPPLPSFGTRTSALSFEPVRKRKLSDLSR